jgi:uncharacterized protein (DUF1501 family)
MTAEEPAMTSGPRIWSPTRRTLLKTGAAAAGVAAVAGSSGAVLVDGLARTPAAFGARPGRLVVVFLRGGQDGLSQVVPYTESAYYAARPTIAIPANQVLPLDAQFGLHPAMTGLHELYQAGKLAVVVGAGNLAGNRSHFTAQDLWEFGATSAPADASGWLARYLNATATSTDSVFRGVTIGNNVNASLRGYPALGLATINGFGLGGLSGANGALAPMIRSQYSGNLAVEQTGIRALDASSRVGTLSGSTAPDPEARAFADLAVLLDADLGVEVATMNLGGWDTHNNMGTAATGQMRSLLQGLSAHLSAFQADLDARGLTDVTTVVMTEFGRRVAQNGSGGTDHGFGCVMLVLGDDVHGGQVHGQWAGLSPAVIGARGDVVPTVDFRNVLGDCARDVLGLANPSSLFPGHTYVPVGVTG